MQRPPNPDESSFQIFQNTMDQTLRSRTIETLNRHGMLLAVLVFGLVSIVFGEKVPTGGGLGWDGAIYGHMVRDLPDMLLHGGLSTYYAQRILPSAIVRLGLGLAGLEPSNRNIIGAFELYDLVLLLAVAFLWEKIALHAKLLTATRWLGFVGLFVNFEASKQTLYYPVLTDATALFIGALLLWLALVRRPVAIFLVSIVGAFAWPTIALTGACLILTPAAKSPSTRQHVEAGSLEFGEPRWGRFLALLVATVAVVGVFRLADDGLCRGLLNAAPRFAGIGQYSSKLAGLPDPCSSFAKLATAVPAIVGACWLAWTLLRPQRPVAAVGRALKAIGPARAALAVATLVIPAILVATLANRSLPNPSGIRVLAYLVFQPAPGKLLLGLVSAISFWGPMVIVILMLWPRFCAQVREQGFGFRVVVAVGVMLGVIGEPRFLTAAWPFFLLGACLAVNRMGPPRRFVAAFLATSLLLAQFWLPLNAVPWTGGDSEFLDVLPKQLYFMHYGLWMAWPSYVGQLIAFAACAAWLATSVRASTPDGTRNAATLWKADAA